MELDALRLFVRVAELGSFSRAAEQLGTPKSRASTRVQELEAELGVRLLHRTTRQVRVTPDGERFLERGKRLLADAEDLQSLFQRAPGAVRGRVRVDMPIGLARAVVIPKLPEFLAAYPQIEVQLSASDRRVNLVQDGFDCVVRIGALRDSGHFAKRIGDLGMLNCASPAYLRKYGMPLTLEDLDRHYLVLYSLALRGVDDGWEYFDGERYRVKPMRGLVTVNNTDAYEAACLAGLGLIQAPALGMRRWLAEGRLVEVLPELESEPMPVSLVYANPRNMPKRVRALMTWLAEVLEPHLEAKK